MKWRIGLGLTILIGLLGVQSLLAQETIWVTSNGTAPVAAGDTKKARRQAIEIAERRAVAKALAPGVSVKTMLVNLRLSGSIVGAIPYGRVVSKKILTEGKVKATGADHGSMDMLYRVKIKAGVARQVVGDDPTFSLDASINKSVFKDGDELEIRMQSTRACYFAIFNILENKKIIRLLPNYLSTKNSLKAEEAYVFPGRKDRQKGLKLQLHLPAKQKAVTESIYILALTHPFELGSINVQEGIFGVYNGETLFMKDLIQEVVSIPLASRAEALMQYEIRKTR